MTHPPRDILADDKMSPDAAAESHAFHRDFVDEVKAAVARDRIVVIGMGQNPVVRRAKKMLNEAKLPFTSIDHGNYLTGYRRRLAIKMWTGFPTFPQVFVEGTLIGGARELGKLLAAGNLK